MKQISLHNKIDEFVKAGVEAADASVARELIVSNFDAKDYFFYSLSPQWINWLHENGFFTVLNEPAEDQTRYSFRTPELGYLEKAVSEKSDEVTAIMLEVDPVKNFNPEVIDRFTRITESLTGENLKKVVEKMQTENWVHLMAKFNNWPYAYKDILENVREANDVGSLLKLTDILLTVKPERDTVRSNPFVIDNINDTSLFDDLLALEGAEAVQALEIVTARLRDVIGSKKDEDTSGRVFAVDEPFYLFDIDLFNHALHEKYSGSHRDDMENFMAVVAGLVRNVFEGNCENDDLLKSVYEKINKTLPESRTAWKVRLFTLSFCPKLFAVELEEAFNRLFVVMEEDKSYYEIESGTEYKKALAKSFRALSADFKQQFVENIFKYFNPSSFEGEEKKWRSRDALQLLKVVKDDLSDEVMQKAESLYGTSPADDRVPDPEPAVLRGESGMVQDRSPIAIADLPVSDIPSLLATELQPKQIQAKFKDDHFLRPRNAEGVGSELRSDIQVRLDEYLDIIGQFYNPEKIDPHYLYSLLVGVEHALRDGKQFTAGRWEKLFAVIEQAEGQSGEIEREKGDSYLAGWESVRQWGADVLKRTLDKDFLDDEAFLNNRERILATLDSLTKRGGPKPEHETGKYGGLFTVAINNTRGVAYQALVQFIYKDGKELKPDSEKLFETLLEENDSLAVWFVIGHYLPSFYFRDVAWANKQLAKIFVTDKPTQFFSAWEGYLLAPVYKEIFVEMEQYYSFALGQTTESYPERNDRAQDLDGAIGTHLSLAYTHFDMMNLEHPLIVKLWKEASAKKQEGFVAHVGRSMLSSDKVTPSEEQLSKICELWDWLLGKEDIPASVFAEFGFWVHRDKDLISRKELAKRMAKTLERSGGLLEYDYNLKERLMDFAEADPDSTLTILENMLLKGTLDNRDSMWIRMDAAKVEIFKTLYAHDPERTKRMINDLWEHPNGGRQFWGLKEVLG